MSMLSLNKYKVTAFFESKEYFSYIYDYTKKEAREKGLKQIAFVHHLDRKKLYNVKVEQLEMPNTFCYG